MFNKFEGKIQYLSTCLKGCHWLRDEKKGQYLKGCFKEKEMVKASSAVMFSLNPKNDHTLHLQN